MIKPVKTKLVNIWEDSNEIVHVEFLEHIEVTDEDAKEFLELCEEEGITCRVLEKE